MTSPPPGLESFHPVVQRWFAEAFPEPTQAQRKAWPSIAGGENTLLLAPTGSGKTLAAFLVAIDRIVFADEPPAPGIRVLYVSPLKALGVDVERNLRSPIAGVRTVAEREGVPHRVPSVGIRSGDTPASERYRLTRTPPDILITTPESLYLMLTSRARSILETIDTVIIDEIHVMVASKRGSHLFLSLERLEALRRANHPERPPMQRIGLSATQRPLDEIAELLGGCELASPDEDPAPRPVRIVEAGRSREIDLTIEVPVEDMARLAEAADDTGPAAGGPTIPSIWPAIYPRLVELVRSHRSTLIFANSRRLAERLAAAINEEADEEIARAHHGSISKDARVDIEDRLKRGEIPVLVATSSLELGIDMGAIDLVIQVESPPSIAAGIQRVGRANHQVGGRSEGVLFPKYRGDLLASSAAAERMLAGEVEESRYPRNPLDVLAQQIVAMAALEPVETDDVLRTVRSAAPFRDLPRSSFEGVLDLLAGRYPSDEFSGLRPRLNWDRLAGKLSPRRGSQRTAILNGGTIPDHGLFGVYLAGDGDGADGSRVGELDEEMVLETKPGDVFLLGASSWRVVDITQDRVRVVPAPGEPGRMPFWRGEGPGRPLEFGRAIGTLARTLLRQPRADAEQRLVEDHGLQPGAARNLLDYLIEQREATGTEPSDRTIVVESFVDEIGDWRIAVLSPFGARVHAPWATAVASRLREEVAGEVDVMWTDDGMAFRVPESEAPPEIDRFFPSPDEIEDIVVREIGQTALFAARFRENAARALLIPRRAPGRRTPLWLQRRRSADLLAVASRYRSFPILLETYRECLRDVYDVHGLREILKEVRDRTIRVHALETRKPSPFASALLFGYAANFLYDGDTPLSERRARTLALDLAQLRELLGDAEMRELLVAEIVDAAALELQRLDGKHPIRHAEGLHDLLRYIGDLTHGEIEARADTPENREGHPDAWISQLLKDRRIFEARIAGEIRYAAAEDASRLRDALGVVPSAGLPDAFLESVEDALGDLVSRYARTHAPFSLQAAATRFGLGIEPVRAALERLAAAGRVVEGEFTPGGRGREWCDTTVLRLLKQRSLARLRKEIEPVATPRLATFLAHWHGLTRRRRGLDALLDVIEQLQGTPLPFSTLERDILPARLEGYRPADLDELCAAGEVVWRGIDSLGTNDGRIALYLTGDHDKLAPRQDPAEGELAASIRELLTERGALFFEEIHRIVGGFKDDLLAALWNLVWSGEVGNDTFAPLRSRFGPSPSSARGRRETGRRRDPGRRFRSRRTPKPPGSEGRWSRLGPDPEHGPTPTERQAALAQQLIERYGILTREMVLAEGTAGGFAEVYPVLKAMEEAGRIRRGYFVAGLGAAQFAAPGADERLRSDTQPDEDRESTTFVLAATDPANPYGAAIRWPESSCDARPMRAAGAHVVLHDGELVGHLGRSGRNLLTFLPSTEPDRERAAAALADALASRGTPRAAAQIETVDGLAAPESPFAARLEAAGFERSAKGYLSRGRADDESAAPKPHHPRPRDARR